jgi:hypothetical protein
MVRWIRRIGFALLVLGVLYSAAYLWVGSVADSRLEAELAAIRERGEPMRLTEMAPPPIPDEENAAIPLAEVVDLLKDDTMEEGEAVDALFEAPFDAGEETAALVRAYVDRNSEALAKIEEAARRPACHFDFEAMVMPLIDGGKLLVARALLHARDGGIDAAVEDLRSAVRMARLTGSDPVVILFLSRIAVEARALSALEEVLRRHALSEKARERLLAFLNGAETRRGLQRAFLGERCFGLSAYESIAGGETPDWSDPRSHWVPHPVLRLDEARYLKLMGRALDLAGRPYHEARSGWSALEAEAADSPWYGTLSGVILVTLTPIVVRVEEHCARLDMARIALGGTAGGPDPFTGKPYAIRDAADGGREVRSPGADPDDEEDDIVWRLPSR